MPKPTVAKRLSAVEAEIAAMKMDTCARTGGHYYHVKQYFPGSTTEAPYFHLVCRQCLASRTLYVHTLTRIQRKIVRKALGL